MLRSFLRWWRYPKPRPSLRQWIRGYRGSLWLDGKHVGFTKNFTVTTSQKVSISMKVDELANMPVEAFMGVDLAAKERDKTASALVRHYSDGKVERVYHNAPAGHSWCPHCYMIHRDNDPSDRCEKARRDTDINS